MSQRNRAAQFSPFAALTGYDAAIKETGRLTTERIELGEDAKEVLNRKHAYLFKELRNPLDYHYVFSRREKISRCICNGD